MAESNGRVVLVEWRDVSVGTIVRMDDGSSSEVWSVARSAPLADGRPGQMRVGLDSGIKSVWPTTQVWVEIGL